jgi:hypothetical protein
MELTFGFQHLILHQRNSPPDSGKTIHIGRVSTKTHPSASDKEQ